MGVRREPLSSAMWRHGGRRRGVPGPQQGHIGFSVNMYQLAAASPGEGIASGNKPPLGSYGGYDDVTNATLEARG